MYQQGDRVLRKDISNGIEEGFVLHTWPPYETGEELFLYAAFIHRSVASFGEVG